MKNNKKANQEITYASLMSSPIGLIRIVTTQTQLLELQFEKEHVSSFDQNLQIEDTGILDLHQLIKIQLQEYFEGTRREFQLPYLMKGTSFQQQVYKALLKIPYGTTSSYQDIAIAIGNPKACRAVGMANHNNCLPILIPCHRVVGANKSLVGYAGGLGTKVKLLEIEGVGGF
jgi:methylated-DNA-[protein]-cysteine S-methyltransferase